MFWFFWPQGNWDPRSLIRDCSDLQVEGKVLTTGRPRKSRGLYFERFICLAEGRGWPEADVGAGTFTPPAPIQAKAVPKKAALRA